jgi:hypothetical protein
MGARARSAAWTAIDLENARTPHHGTGIKKKDNKGKRQKREDFK